MPLASLCPNYPTHSLVEMALQAFAHCLLAAVGGNHSLVAFPSQANYSAIVAPYNLDIPVTPAAVAFPYNATGVAALVKCAVTSGYKVQAKSGGHSSANYGIITTYTFISSLHQMNAYDSYCG